ncbi:MAG: hypothetical protein GY800_13865, partial [Planctomycetes bacterium]|nr:hypothetical protein [Planctomycetota bacterium]
TAVLIRALQEAFRGDCFKCGGRGHMANICPTKETSATWKGPTSHPAKPVIDKPPLKDIECYRCREKGHIMRDCPRNKQQESKPLQDQTTAPETTTKVRRLAAEKEKAAENEPTDSEDDPDDLPQHCRIRAANASEAPHRKAGINKKLYNANSYGYDDMDEVEGEVRVRTTKTPSCRSLKRATHQMYIKLSIHGTPYFFLLDTGADVSIIHPQVYYNIARRVRAKLTKVRPLGSAVKGGKYDNTSGQTRVQASCAGYSWNMPV